MTKVYLLDADGTTISAHSSLEGVMNAAAEIGVSSMWKPDEDGDLSATCNVIFDGNLVDKWCIIDFELDATPDIKMGEYEFQDTVWIHDYSSPGIGHFVPFEVTLRKQMRPKSWLSSENDYDSAYEVIEKKLPRDRLDKFVAALLRDGFKASRNDTTSFSRERIETIDNS